MKSYYSYSPNDIAGFDSLSGLALDMRWSWDHSADEIWCEIDPVLWNLTHNPMVVLQTVSRDRLQTLMKETAFRNRIDALVKSKNVANKSSAWFQQNYPHSSLTCVA